MAAASIKTVRRPAANGDSLLRGFHRLCQQLGRPYAEAEIRAAARHHVAHVDRGGLIEALDLAARL
ncbi:MAG TPA: hypothetical protein VFR67_10115 [Pilimelia sp.]|nr:hypothetical protein [Pilimelia sp.]